MGVDWNFIAKWEKAHMLHGYVPNDGSGNPIANSGVTISTGIDLGQMNMQDLYNLFLEAHIGWSDLVDKLAPYVGLKRYKAIQFLKDYPLVINKDESSILDTLMKKRVLRALTQQWKRDTQSNFKDLPDAVQTVLFSLAWNLGDNLSDKYPTTWGKFVSSFSSKDWGIAYKWMDSFPSKNEQLKPRRADEAALLKYLTVIH